MTEEQLQQIEYRHLNMLGLTYEEINRLFDEIRTLNGQVVKLTNENEGLKQTVTGMDLLIYAQEEVITKRKEKFFNG